jgi:pyrroline-5-carboxylate reductase
MHAVSGSGPAYRLYYLIEALRDAAIGCGLDPENRRPAGIKKNCLGAVTIYAATWKSRNLRAQHNSKGGNRGRDQDAAPKAPANWFEGSHQRRIAQ